VSTGGPVPSMLDDVLAFAIALLVQAGEADYPHVDGSGKTEVLIGERYLEQTGAARRILFVPTQDGGELGPPLEIGARQIGSITEGCTAYVWGAETTDDRDRYREAKRIMMKLIATLNEAGIGRRGFGTIRRMTAGDVDTYGEEYRLSFTYTWAVPRDAAIDAAALVLAGQSGYSKSPEDPDRPFGSTGIDFQAEATMENDRP